MAIEAQLCPQCGSTVHFKEGQTSVVCDYCGTTVTLSVIPEVSLKKEQEDEQILQQVSDLTNRLLNEGTPATGKILTARTTDIYKNGLEGRAVLMAFTVEVHPKGEAPFQVETKAPVRLTSVDKYQPGTVLDVAYDPQDHTQVSVEGRHDQPDKFFQQMREANEQIRKGDEMIRQADAEYEQGEKEYEEGEEEEKQADEKLAKLHRKK